MGKGPTKIKMPLRVRYIECDPMGFVHHSRYAVWFEMARTELLRQQGLSYADMEKAGTYVVVVHLNIHFKKPACYDEEIEIIARLKRSGGAKIEHGYEVHRNGELLCTAETVLACIDREGRIKRVPRELMQDA